MFQETGAVTRFPSAVMPERPQPAERDERTSPAEIFAVLWRRRLWIALGTLAGLLAAVAFLAVVPPRYMAVAQLLIDPNDLRVMDNAVTPSNTLNEATTAYVESQARVLTSDTVLRKVIEQQRLDKDSEFMQPPSALRAALTVVLQKFGVARQRDPDPVVAVLQELAPKVGARRQERTYVVDLTASTRDPEKSARIANAIVAAYLEDQADARTTSAKRATDALSGRLHELKDRVREAENRAETFKAQNNLVSASGQLVSEQALSELTNQLTVAGAKADEAKARLDQIEALRRGRVDAGAIAEAVQSQTVAALRAQHGEVLRRKAELTARLGERHPSIADINAQAHDLQQQVDREVGRLSQAARGDYERAQATRQALLARLNGLKQEAVTTNQSLVRLRELEREVEASRAVYQAYLTRSRETSEQERVNTTNVRVLSEANVPNKRAFPPRTLIVLALALMFGAAAGAGAGFARDWTDDRIHTRRDLETACTFPILAEIASLSVEFRGQGLVAAAARQASRASSWSDRHGDPPGCTEFGFRRWHPPPALHAADDCSECHADDPALESRPTRRALGRLAQSQPRRRIEPVARAARRCGPQGARHLTPRGGRQRWRPPRCGQRQRETRAGADRRDRDRPDGLAGRARFEQSGLES